jgi:MFS family permease
LEKEGLQWLLAANGAGMIIGGGITMMFSNRVSAYILLMLGMVINAIGISIIGFSTLFWFTLLIEFCIGLAMPALQIGINTIILNNTEEAFIGRVNGILTPMFMGSMVITMSLAGLLKEQFSLFTSYQAAAVLFGIGALVLLPLLGTSAKKEPDQISA